MRTNLYMVRHAESPFEFGKEKSRGLSEEGMTAARRVASIFSTIEVHYIASSSYTRAIQTVQPLAEQTNIPVIEYDELIERPIKGLDTKAPWDALLEAIRRSFEDKDYALEGGESTREAQERAIPVIEKLLEEQKGNNIVLGTHGNIMTIIMNYYNEAYGFEFWEQTSKPDIYKLTFDGNKLENVERLWA